MFYVYLHCIPDGPPFYVGKGSGTRAHNFSKAIRNAQHLQIVRQYGKDNIEVLLIPCDDEEDAYRMEQSGIHFLRLLGFDLVNQTDGGLGMHGWQHRPQSRKRISESLRKTMSTPDFKRKRSEASKRAHTDEVRYIKSCISTDQWADPAIRATRIAALRGYRWITDGTANRQLRNDDSVPTGWYFGRAPGTNDPKPRSY